MEEDSSAWVAAETVEEGLVEAVVEVVEVTVEVVGLAVSMRVAPQGSTSPPPSSTAHSHSQPCRLLHLRPFAHARPSPARMRPSAPPDTRGTTPSRPRSRLDFSQSRTESR